MQNPTHEPGRWGNTSQLIARYPLSRSRAYELLRENRLRARKLGRRTIWDFNSADELFESLPDCGQEA